MFDRKDRLDIDNISFLEKRVDNNLDKLSSLNVKVGMNLLDKEKIEKFIMKVSLFLYQIFRILNN